MILLLQLCVYSLFIRARWAPHVPVATLLSGLTRNVTFWFCLSYLNAYKETFHCPILQPGQLVSSRGAMPTVHMNWRWELDVGRIKRPFVLPRWPFRSEEVFCASRSLFSRLPQLLKHWNLTPGSEAACLRLKSIHCPLRWLRVIVQAGKSKDGTWAERPPLWRRRKLREARRTRTGGGSGE